MQGEKEILEMTAQPIREIFGERDFGADPKTVVYLKIGVTCPLYQRLGAGRRILAQD